MITEILMLITSFLAVVYVMPHSIRKLRENGYLVRDMYKPERNLVPTNAGIIVLFTSFISIALTPLLTRIASELISISDSSVLSEVNLALLLVVSIYAIYGLVDDLVDIGRKMKLILPITFAFPLIPLISIDIVWFPLIGNLDLTDIFFRDISYSDLFRLIIIPVYVMVVSNLINMHSGYNGLQSGLSIILISTLFLKSLIDGILDTILPAWAFFGAMLALWIFNRYPSRVFEGNVGSLLFGSILGCIIVIQEYWWFGFFILVPHTFNFLLWLFWLYHMRKYPQLYLDASGRHTKYGRIRSDGTIKVPNFLTLKWIPNYFFRLKENESVFISYSITIIFCIIGLLIF